METEAKATGFDHLEGQPPTWPVPLGLTAFSTPLCPASSTHSPSRCNYIFPVQEWWAEEVVLSADNHPLASTVWSKSFFRLPAPSLPSPLPGLNFLRFFPAVTATPRLWFPPAPSLLGQKAQPSPRPSGQCLCLQRTL